MLQEGREGATYVLAGEGWNGVEMAEWLLDSAAMATLEIVSQQSREARSLFGVSGGANWECRTEGGQLFLEVLL